MSDTAVKKLPPLTLRAIYLRGSSVKFEDNFDPLKPGQQLNIETKFYPHSYFVSGNTGSTESENIARSYTFLTEFETTYFLASEPSASDPVALSQATQVVRISAIFASDYLIASGSEQLLDSDAQAWANSAALMHSWPYWREFSHSTMMKANMPVVLVPMLVAQHAPEAGAVETPLATKAKRGRTLRNPASVKSVATSALSQKVTASKSKGK